MGKMNPTFTISPTIPNKGRHNRLPNACYELTECKARILLNLNTIEKKQSNKQNKKTIESCISMYKH